MKLKDKEILKMIQEEMEIEMEIKKQDNLNQLYRLQSKNMEGYTGFFNTTIPRNEYWNQISKLIN